MAPVPSTHEAPVVRAGSAQKPAQPLAPGSITPSYVSGWRSDVPGTRLVLCVSCVLYEVTEKKILLCSCSGGHSP